MTAQEFGEWRVWYHTEQQQPAVDRLHHGQLLAATMNGALTRKTGGMFTASELVEADVWAPPIALAAAVQPTTEQVAAQIEALNARME